MKNTPSFPLLVAATLAHFGGDAMAQPAYPSKQVNVITAFAAGSGPDVVLRLVGQKLGQRWQQPVTVENRPGGGGFVAIEAMRRAPPDGHTLLQLDSEHVSALPYLYARRDFDTSRHFDAVAPLYLTPFFVAVPVQSPWKTMDDLIQAARAEPGRISYGSWGVGSPGHLGGEWLDYLTGSSMVHVPYREVSQLFASVANGAPDWSFASIPSSQGIYRAGRLRYLAVASPRRSPQMPDVPTVAESGGPAELDVNSFVSLLAPKGISPAVRDRIHADVVAVLLEPEVREKLASFAFQPVTWSPAQMEQFARDKARQYEMLIQKANIRLD